MLLYLFGQSLLGILLRKGLTALFETTDHRCRSGNIAAKIYESLRFRLNAASGVN